MKMCNFKIASTLYAIAGESWKSSSISFDVVYMLPKTLPDDDQKTAQNCIQIATYLTKTTSRWLHNFKYRFRVYRAWLCKPNQENSCDNLASPCNVDGATKSAAPLRNISQNPHLPVRSKASQKQLLHCCWKPLRGRPAYMSNYTEYSHHHIWISI